MRIDLSSIRAIALLLSIVVLLGCVTRLPQTTDRFDDPVDRRIYLEQQIVSALTTDPLRAAMLIMNEELNPEFFIDQELEEYKEQVIEAISKEIDSAMNEGNFKLAEALYASLANVSPEALQQYDREKLQLMKVRNYLSKDHYLPLLLALNSLKSLSALETSELQEVLEISLQHNNRTQLIRIIDELSKRGRSVDRKFSQFSRTEAVNFDVMLNGTVTVVVDRGFKIERGVAIPDRAIGSGFFIDSRGYLITNYHVISSEVDPTYEGYTRLHLRIANDANARIPAKVVSYDRSLDIALVKAEVVPGYIFPLTDKINDLTPGKRIYALGSPVGLQNSITSGIVSSTGRHFLPIGESLQIDVPVNPGNSGGPLVDDRGQLVGVVFAGIVELQGINFAIPARWLQRSIPKLFLEEGQVEHFWIGANMLATSTGLEVLYLFPGSPAQSIGIQVSDFVDSIDGQPIQTSSDAQYILDGYQDVALIPLTWRRDEERFRRFILLSNRPFSPIEDALKIEQREALFPPLFGMQVSRISPTNSRRFVVQRIYSGTVADELGISVLDPLTLLSWEVDSERRIVVMQISTQKRRAGFTNSGLQILGRIDLANFI